MNLKIEYKMTTTLSYKELSDIMYEACMLGNSNKLNILEHTLYALPFKSILIKHYKVQDLYKIPIDLINKALGMVFNGLKV